MKLRDLRTKLGPLWWYTLMIFLVQRFGDVINAFIGVWLVPRYMPMEELGSLRPLMQIGALLGMPIGLLVALGQQVVQGLAVVHTRGKAARERQGSLVRSHSGEAAHTAPQRGVGVAWTSAAACSAAACALPAWASGATRRAPLKRFCQ